MKSPQRKESCDFMKGKQPTARISTYHQLWIHKLMMVLEISAVG
jgi:hypothetical protein